ncbi:50S ribosomal protein L25/general stress protein Ctc [Phormidium sp. FACHB-592]|uniref:Large ribosomal subunit protein bL25 n=1 Tax=Stenomitos frigidus AS-A4 TaxID=2933935 RepID=A0ABV0KKY0_9CYAN|nr:MULTISPECIES: 50S ribosomal protein L25/general stress protein Ctc [Cyanophyceae]MBD2036694.1 50S ribosomal protein L25/general stress protein Ctc [Leptolyngbya sp. FACHB-321]MBD2075326.1 50S ribosomal protein L25/general stress protein Ctc [Phormidium sp. FACHB-592]
MELTLECQTRPAGSKANALRRAGLIPAVLYGHKGAESVSLTVKAKTAELLVRDASVNNTLIQVNVPEIPWKGKALLREVHSHPWRGYVYHLSFFSVGSQESLDVDVPIHLVGEATGVKNGGGSIDHGLTELQVRCAPDLIPESIEIDVTGLDVGDSLHVHELTLPNGVTALGEPDRVVVTVLAPSSTVAAEAAEEEAAAAAASTSGT